MDGNNLSQLVTMIVLSITWFNSVKSIARKKQSYPEHCHCFMPSFVIFEDQVFGSAHSMAQGIVHHGGL